MPFSGKCWAAGGRWEFLCASRCRCGYQKLWPTSGSQVSFTRLSPEVGFQSSSTLFLALGKASGGQSVASELVLDATGVLQSCPHPHPDVGRQVTPRGRGCLCVQGSRPWVADPHQRQRPQPRGSRPGSSQNGDVWFKSGFPAWSFSPARGRSLVG